MEAVSETRATFRHFPPSWSAILSSLLPLWLLSLAISVEGFPHPPIPGWLGITAFFGAIAAGSVLLWRKWITIELLLFSILPYTLLVTFDEISTAYKTPFIFSCALLLSAGVVGYQRTHNRLLGSLILLAAAALMLLAATHATNRFWEMVSALGYHECFPDFPGCAPLTGNETPWWKLFFSD